ncbi:MAG: Arc family DNA-binding protein [Candidatus Coatesbacteria bacterium]
MPVSLSIKNVPNAVVKQLRRRATRHHRSLQGELMAIIQEHAADDVLSIAEAARHLKAIGVRTSADSTRIIREGRDAR